MSDRRRFRPQVQGLEERLVLSGNNLFDNLGNWFKSAFGFNDKTKTAPPPNPAAIPSTANNYIDNTYGADVWMNFHKLYVAKGQNPDLKTVLLGDSITAYFSGQPAYQRLAAFGVDDFGIPGDETQNVLWRVQNGELDHHPKVVVLMIGINNLYAGQTPQQTAGGIRAVVRAIHRHSPTSKILLMGILPSMQAANDPVRAKITETNRIISRLDRLPYVTYEDIGSQFVTPDGTLRMDLLPDQTHPSNAGYNIYVDALQGPLTTLLAGGSPDSTAGPHAHVHARAHAHARKFVGLDISTANPAANPSTANPYIDHTYGHQVWANFHTLFSAQIRNPQVQTVLLGDSITAYFGNQPALATLNKFYPADFGIPGDQTQNILWRVENGEVAGRPKVVVLMAGINNLYAGDTPAQTAGGIAAIVKAIHQESPRTKVVLLGLLPSMQSATDPVRAKIFQTNALIRRLDRLPYVTYKDFGSRFLAPDGSLRMDLMPDQTHPSPQGYVVFADELQAPLSNLLGRRPVPRASTAAHLARRGHAARARA